MELVVDMIFKFNIWLVLGSENTLKGFPETKIVEIGKMYQNKLNAIKNHYFFS